MIDPAYRKVLYSYSLLDEDLTELDKMPDMITATTIHEHPWGMLYAIFTRLNRQANEKAEIATMLKDSVGIIGDAE